MADMISRQYALAVIENQIVMKEPEEGTPEIFEAYKSGFRDAMKQIRLDLMTVPVREKWIPMSVRHPVDGEYVILSSEDDVGVGIFRENGEQNSHIKAWMPLPIPYAEPKRIRRKKK